MSAEVVASTSPLDKLGPAVEHIIGALAPVSIFGDGAHPVKMG